MPDTPGCGPETLLPWLSLSLDSGLGDAALSRLASQYAAARQSPFDAADAELVRLGLARNTLERLRNCQAKLARYGPSPAVRAAIEWSLQPGNDLLLAGSDAYPPMLAAVPSPPPLLYCRGLSVPAGPPALAIVGARRGTGAGRETAANLAAALGELGFTVVSGLALGIDAAAHAAALDAGGFTVAVLGCGADVIYPSSNRALYGRIPRQGCLVSEFPPGAPPRRQHFPRRNRIISGMSVGVVVVEAGLRSGSLVTARHALEQGREVFAVPGSVHSPVSRGCHRLIRDGATLVENVDDILNNLPDWALPATGKPAPRPVDRPRLGRVPARLRRVHEALEYAPLEVDRVVARTGLEVPVVMAALVELELSGHARCESGAYARRSAAAS